MSDAAKPPKYPILDDIEVPEDVMANWQTTADLLAEMAGVPAALIMRLHASEIEVFVSSHNTGNVYHPGDKSPLDLGLYCETVLSSRRELLVPNAFKDQLWERNPDIEQGMISYCGLPLTWPTGELFGTICVLDKKENVFNHRMHPLMERFRASIQLSLECIYNASVECKQAEAALGRSEEKFRHLYESSRDAIMTVTPDGGFLGGNKATIEMFGCRDEQEFITLSPAVASPEFQPDGRRSVDKAQEMMRLALEKGSHFFEWTHKRMDGTEFYADVLLTKTEFGGKKLLQATVRDITERKQADIELTKHREQLEELVKTRTTELQEKNQELERFNKLFVGRELRMVELKEKIKELERQAMAQPGGGK